MKIDKREILEDELLYIREELVKLHELIVNAKTEFELDVLVGRHHTLKEYSNKLIRELETMK